MLEIFNNLFMSIAEQMGLTPREHGATRSTSRSGSISPARCSTPTGDLIANAPHMPVHLGSMGESVARDRDENARDDAARATSYVLNDPYNGGTHLPDVTVITPVFDDAGRGRSSSTSARRGHHADIGGITPGSMPPDSTHLDEEGVLIDNFLLVDAGHAARGGDARAPRRARYPARNVEQNMADLRAMVAANEKGVAGAGAHGRSLRARRRSTPTCATCRTTPRNRCGA